MKVTELVNYIKASKQHCYLYHFTDERNFPLIKKHGLLSKDEMRKQGFWPVAPSGNQWSWDADAAKGVSQYISLGMTINHPMQHVARSEGRVVTLKHLCISPDVLLTPGVLFASDIANKSGVQLKPFDEALQEIDVEILYTRTDWSNAEMQTRLRTAEKYEILVPGCIELGSILKAI